MRELTIKQKNLLKKWYKESLPTEKERIIGIDKKIRRVEDLTNEQYNLLESINDTEVLYQNVNRFLNDLVSSDLNG